MEAKFSPKVKEVITFSREEALRLGHDYIGIEHLMLGLIRDGDGLAIKILQNLDIDLILLRRNIEDAVKGKVSKNVYNASSLPLTKQAEKVLKITVLEAKVMKSDMIGTEHLFLSILKSKDNVAVQILAKYGVDYEDFKTELDFVKNDIHSQMSNDPPDDEFDDESKSRKSFGGGGGSSW